MPTQEEFHKNFLENFFNQEEYNVYSLAGDASNRRYYRVIKDGQSWVLMRWEAYDPKTYPFLSVQEHFLKHHVKVPQIVAMAPTEGLLLLEDLGDLTLERKFWESQNQEGSLDFYKASVDELVKIHFHASRDKSSCVAFQIQFDTAKFLWEMKYGQDNLLSGICKFPFSDDLNKQVTNLFTKICERLHQEPKFIAHRDYHSRNVMIKFNEVRVIDFQDARLGPIQYDLVSLFRDSYVNMNDHMSHTLINYYLDQAKPFLGSQFSMEHFHRIYELQTIQRCFKACGSFASFYNSRQDTRYLKYISHTLRRVLKSLNEFPEYKLFADVLIDSGALERKYEAL